MVLLLEIYSVDNYCYLFIIIELKFELKFISTTTITTTTLYIQCIQYKLLRKKRKISTILIMFTLIIV